MASQVDVLLVAYSPPVGAVAELFGSLTTNLSEVANVAVLAPHALPVDAAVAADLRFEYSARRPYTAVVGAGWRAHRAAARLRPRSVLYFTQHPLNLIALAHLRSSPSIYWWHEPAPRGQVSRAKALMYRLNDGVIGPLSRAIVVATPSALHALPKALAAKTRVVPFPVPPGFDEDSGRFGDVPVDIVFFGKFERYKGLDVLADALNMLAEDGAPPSLRMIGAGDLDVAAPRMRRYVSEHADHVDVINEYAPAADVHSAMVNARCAVFPYLSAAGSSTVAIAAMLATPVVASRVGCFGDYLVDGWSGLLVPPGDPRRLATALLRILDHDAERRQLAVGIGELAASVFDAQATARLLTTIVDEVSTCQCSNPAR